jgi:hypothetical protein
LAYDPYIKDDIQANVLDMINRNRADISWPGYYAWATAKAPGKPIMLAEWGVDIGSNANPSSKLNIDVNQIVRQYPMLKAMVYWNDIDQLNVRIDDTTAKGLAYGAAFRQFAAHPTFNAMTPNSAP